MDENVLIFSLDLMYYEKVEVTGSSIKVKEQFYMKNSHTELYYILIATFTDHIISFCPHACDLTIHINNFFVLYSL